MLQKVEGLRVAEKAGDADQKFSVQCPALFAGMLQKIDIIAQILDLVDTHPPLDAADDGVVFIAGEINPTRLLHQRKQFAHPILIIGDGRLDGRVGGQTGMFDITHQAGRHLFGRGDIIDQLGGHRAAGHPVKLGRLILGHDHPPHLFDGPDTPRAVAARAG